MARLVVTVGCDWCVTDQKLWYSAGCQLITAGAYDCEASLCWSLWSRLIQLLDRSPWNIVHTFMVPGGWVIQTGQWGRSFSKGRQTESQQLSISISSEWQCWTSGCWTWPQAQTLAQRCDPQLDDMASCCQLGVIHFLSSSPLSLTFPISFTFVLYSTFYLFCDVLYVADWWTTVDQSLLLPQARWTWTQLTRY